MKRQRTVSKPPLAIALVCAALASTVVHAATISDFFSADTTGSWTALSGANWTHDVADGEADLPVGNARWMIRYDVTTGATDHECQASYQLGNSSSHVNVGMAAVRMPNTGSNQEGYFFQLDQRAQTIGLHRRNTGTTGSGGSTQLGTNQAFATADNDFVTVRIAAIGNNISLWWHNDGTSKLLSDPGWIGADGSPNYTQTDSSYTDADHQFGGLAGHGSGLDYDTRTDWFKCRAISDRAGTTAAPRLLLLGIGGHQRQ